MRDLYEAYLGIYEAKVDKGTPLEKEDIRNTRSNSKFNFGTAQNKIVPLRKEELEFILAYLVSECYADDYKSANYILESMSEEWADTILCEKYYEPTETLPNSNKTPLQKAIEKSRKRAKTIATQSRDNQDRWGRHYDKIHTHVKHGADNPNLNTNISHLDKDDVKIHRDSDGMSLHHKKSGVSFHVYKPSESDDVHTIEWNHNKDTTKMTRPERINLAKAAKHVWDKHVSHRLPHSSVIHNSPSSDRRGSIYSRVGFGEPDHDNDQFAVTRREPSSKQKKKGKSRLKPIDALNAKWNSDWDKVRSNQDYSESD
jgi:hypothetical protein